MVDYKVIQKKAYISLNRPDKRNALNFEMVHHLKNAFHHASSDDTVKVIILQAEGKVFSAGADLASLQQLQTNTYEENLADSNHLKELYYQIYALNKIVIAKVQGHAIAGGCGLASICDFVFSAPEARFGYTEVRIGFVPALVNVFLIRKIGEMKARELLLTGELISAEEAKNIALINKVVPLGELGEVVDQFADMLIDSNSEQSMAMTKQLIASAGSMTLEEALQHAAETNAKARATTDCQKGIAAFLNKEDLKW